MQHSSARKPSPSWKVGKLELGFSQWAAINAELILGRHEGYRAQRPITCDVLLDEASQVPVILYDTTQRRATQTNAEELILHILLHRQSKRPGFPNTANRGAIEGAAPDRRNKSTRDTMKANAERIVGSSAQLRQPGDRPIFFKDEVERLSFSSTQYGIRYCRNYLATISGTNASDRTASTAGSTCHSSKTPQSTCLQGQ